MEVVAANTTAASVAAASLLTQRLTQFELSVQVTVILADVLSQRAGGSRPEIGRLTLRIVAHRLVVSGITVGADLSEELPLYYAGGWSRHGRVM